jgi:phenylalanyl-tRNA synthetase beta chain
MQNIDIASIASDKVVKISNPISKDMEALRTSLVPSALEVIKNNIFHGSKNLKLFEIGKIYLIDKALKQQTPVKGYFEEERLILIFSGSIKPLTWDEKTRFFDIFDVKGEIVLFFKKVFLDNIKFIPYPISNALSDISIRLELEGRDIGVIGKVRTDILKKFEIEQDVFFAEIKLGAIIENRRKEKSFTPLSKYPVVSRDIALIVKEDILHDKIENEIWKAGYPLITKVELFDIYQGEQIGIGNKSYAFTLEFIAEDHTMTQDEIEGVMNNIIINLEKNLNAFVRK